MNNNIEYQELEIKEEKKSVWFHIERWGRNIGVAAALVAVLWDIRLTNEAIQGVKALQDFQYNQNARNEKESIVYNWALQKLMGTEIHNIPESDEQDNGQ